MQEIEKVEKIQQKNNIVKSNILIDAVYALSANEQKILITAISLLNSHDAENFTTYKITLSALKEILKVDSNDFHRQIKKMTKNILTKPFSYYNEEEKSTLQGSWFSTCKYYEDDGVVVFEFSPEVKRLLLGIKKNFTCYMLGYAVLLKSRFSIRIYELMKKAEYIKSVVYSLDTLRQILSLEDKYALYGHFKKKILDIAKKEINQYTDIQMTFEELKIARRVDRIKFHIKQNIKNIDEKKEPDIFGMTNLSIELENLGVSRDKAMDIVNQYDEDYIKDRIQQFLFEKEYKEEEILKIGYGKYLYNLLKHQEWKDDKYEFFKIQQKRKNKEKEERTEKRRLEELNIEYEQYIDSITPSIDEISEEKKQEIETEIQSRMESILSSKFITFDEKDIENYRQELTLEIVKKQIKIEHPKNKWIAER